MPLIDRDGEYDVVVIGAGSTGENVAGRIVRGGLTCAVVESELVGGDCSYWACMPSKALLRSGQALRAAQAVDGARQAVTGGIDSEAVLRRRDRFASHWKDDSQAQWLETHHIDLARGIGRLDGERRVIVTPPEGAAFTLTARSAVAICTGSRASIPPIPGIESAQAWTSHDATSAKAVPRRLIIIGGGVVACEMADAWRTLGSQEVTLIVREQRLLGNVEDFAGEAVRASFAERGITVLLGTVTERVTRDQTGEVAVVLAGGRSVSGDELLVATGRAPRTDGIGLDTVGLRPGTWLNVDDTCRVEGGGDWLYAAGDLNHRALLTHMGKYQGRACGDAIVARAAGKLSGDPPPWSSYTATADHAAIPQVIFTDPEVSAVGLTHSAAEAAGIRVRVVDYEIGDVSGAGLLADGYTGHARMVVDEDRKVIVGVTFTGPGVGDLIHAATIAVVGEVPLDRLWHAVPSYPTVSEIWLRLLETYGL
ncbi:MAG TPA: NAD(P)/FAD-dependent oxidoreductase [Candidatus Dormibacteraeota bacterium]|nr:NAD(P)/FAD-dependent oxidoreductase [Candidatus Dormibacteraeota bacterium]